MVAAARSTPKGHRKDTNAAMPKAYHPQVRAMFGCKVCRSRFFSLLSVCRRVLRDLERIVRHYEE